MKALRIVFLNPASSSHFDFVTHVGNKMQQMLHVGSGELTSGSTKEDFLEVVCAWQIKNPAQWVLLLEARE